MGGVFTASGGKEDIDMPMTGIREIPFRTLWRPGVAARIAYGRRRDARGL